MDATGADVAIDYAIKFKGEENKPTNLTFSAEGATSNTLEGLNNALTGRINTTDSRTKTITVNWNWEYQTGTTDAAKLAADAQDTSDAGKDFTFDVEITGTQVNPNS